MLIQVLTRFMHSLEHVLELLAAFVILNVVHPQNQLEPLILYHRLMLVLMLVV